MLEKMTYYKCPNVAKQTDFFMLSLGFQKKDMIDRKLSERGDNGLFITLVPKVLSLRFPIRWPNNLGDFY